MTKTIESETPSLWKKLVTYACIGCTVISLEATPSLAAEATQEPVVHNPTSTVVADVREYLEERAKDDVKSNPIF